CGFDPTTKIDELAVAVPEEGERGELGVAATVRVDPEELSSCTAYLTEQRGDRVRSRRVGSFVVVEPASESSPGHARPRLAYGRHGLVVVGQGAWLDAML